MGELAVLADARREADPGGKDESPRERLESQLTTMAAHIAAASAQWLSWLAEYDKSEGYHYWGCGSAAHWLNWKCGISYAAAHEKVRVALALEDLNLVRAAFADGQLSYSKVRALTRVANVDNEPDMLGMALNATAAQLDQICRGINTAKRIADSDAEKAFAARRVTSRCNQDGTTTISAVLPADVAEGVYAAICKQSEVTIREARQSGQSRHEVVQDRGGIAAVRADAFVQLLGGSSEFVPSELTVVVDADSLRGTESGSEGSSTTCRVEGTAVSSSVARRLACDAKLSVVAVDSEGSEVAASGQARTPNRAQRRALARRDHGMCRFPGCSTTRGLHAHHVVHRVDGGLTELDNLILVCNFHHHQLHEGGWNARAIDGGHFEFIHPNGEVVDVPVFRGRVDGLLAGTAHRNIGPATIQQKTYSRLGDLPCVTAMLIHNEGLHRKRRLAAESSAEDSTSQ